MQANAGLSQKADGRASYVLASGEREVALALRRRGFGRCGLAVVLALMIGASALLFGCAGSSGGAGRSDVVRVDDSELSEDVRSGSLDALPGEDPSGSAAAHDAADASALSSESSQGALPVSDIPASSSDASAASAQASSAAVDSKALAKKLYAKLDIEKDYRDSFVHGEKPAKFQKYIVLHDTEGDGEAAGVIEYWDGSGAGVAAHFVVNKDGSIVQCVPLDKITHHAGYGDTGHNEEFGVEDESRDDKVGTTEIGDWASDYGMNSYSIGIELVHVGGSGDYPEEQLQALDDLIAYIDAYYGKESEIIDHKAWRTGNSDTSEEFSDYLENYQDHRTHLSE